MQTKSHTLQLEQDQSRTFDFEQPVLIVGMGKTGVSCARFLKKNMTPFAMADNRENPPMLERIREDFGDINLNTC